MSKKNEKVLPPEGATPAETAETPETIPWVPPFLREKTPIWLYVASALGAFLNFLGFVFLISPHNRNNLLNPPVEQLEAAGLNASQIADRLTYAATISPMMLNAAAGVFLASTIALIFAFRRHIEGVYAYIFLTFVMVVITMSVGLFTPGLLMIPTAVTVTAAMNKEFFR